MERESKLRKARRQSASLSVAQHLSIVVRATVVLFDCAFKSLQSHIWRMQLTAQTINERGRKESRKIEWTEIGLGAALHEAGVAVLRVAAVLAHRADL